MEQHDIAWFHTIGTLLDDVLRAPILPVQTVYVPLNGIQSHFRAGVDEGVVVIPIGRPEQGGALADEAFPEVELLEPDGPVGQPVVPERREPRSRSRSKDVHAGIDNEQSIAAGQDPGCGAQNGKRFAFNNKSEAKRAVIYSEILNRKYD